MYQYDFEKKEIKENCEFCSTLVDRIVTGYPRANAKELCEEFGYEDNIIVTSEIFHTWVIETKDPEKLAKRLPFPEIGLKVIYTKDVHPFKKRKVRILNGAHTCSVLGAYLDGYDIVRDMMKDDTYNAYLKKAFDEEIIPTIKGGELTQENLKEFADAVEFRFNNPFIDHKLLDISLNSTAKFRARVLATITEAYAATGKLLPVLTFSFASLLALERRMQSFNQYILHSSFIQYNDHAILFSAPSGTGKSTQADLWKQYRNALIINGDRTLLSKNEYFIANGWPLCGSSEICFNEHYPLSCIVFLSQGKENNITELDYKDAYKKLISELTINYHNPLFINSAMDFIEDLLKNIKVYHLTCDISEDAVICLENKMKEDFVWMR